MMVRQLSGCCAHLLSTFTQVGIWFWMLQIGEFWPAVVDLPYKHADNFIQ
jgi:hypothetical protein